MTCTALLRLSKCVTNYHFTWKFQATDEKHNENSMGDFTTACTLKHNALSALLITVHSLSYYQKHYESADVVRFNVRPNTL